MSGFLTPRVVTKKVQVVWYSSSSSWALRVHREAEFVVQLENMRAGRTLRGHHGRLGQWQIEKLGLERQQHRPGRRLSLV